MEDYRRLQNISIRAPARGATDGNGCIHLYATISIRAPARGATWKLLVLSIISLDFNPRSREGSDKNRIVPLVLAVVFQSALPRGERHSGCRIGEMLDLFQSALPRGERRNHDSERRGNSNFNPRSREGSDDSTFAILSLNNISIRAPARGATLK